MGRRGGSQPIGPKTPTVLGPTPLTAAAPAHGTRITGQRKERTNNSEVRKLGSISKTRPVNANLFVFVIILPYNGDFVARRMPPRSVRRNARLVLTP
jgi:hypothetical protein